MQMPKNDKNENIDNSQAESTSTASSEQTPAEYTPTSSHDESTAAVTPIEEARTRRLGTGAIIGISAASVALLAGVFGGGIAVANVVGDQDRGPAGQAQVHSEMDDEGSMAQGKQSSQGKQGKHGKGPEGGKPHGPAAGMQPGGLEADGSMPGHVPHQHDAEGNDVIPKGHRATPAPATTN
jgi:hypothetical protein